MAPSVRRTTINGPIKTEAELAEFIWRAFRIRIPDTQVCTKHSTPWRAFCDAYFARSSVSVWKGSRGLAGKTFLMALLTVVEGLTLRVDANLLGGSGGQSTLGLRYVNQFLTESNIVHGGLAANVTHETRLQNGAFLRALMASQTSVRGPHPVRLRLDEVDEMKLDIFDASLGQPMGRNGVESQIVASSTHQYPDGTMTEILKRAAEKGWPVYEWCFRESQAGPYGWLSEAEIERKRSQVPAVMWAVEYELQEPSAEGRAIDTAAVVRMFDRKLGEFDGRVGEKIEIEPPIPDTRYAHGADWARKVDYTDIGTLRIAAVQHTLVAFERLNRMPWDVMVDRFADRLKRYGGAAAHDATGLGDVVDRMLQLTGQHAEPIMFVGRERKDILSEYVAAVEHSEIRAPFIRSIESEHRYCSVDDLFGTGHPPDSVVMGALAYRAWKIVGTPVAAGQAAPDNTTASYGNTRATYRARAGRLTGGRG